MIVKIENGRIIEPYGKTTISGKFELSPVTKKRSTGQNAYLHYILFPQLAEGIGAKLNKTVSMNFAKELVKFMFLKESTVMGTVVKGTSKLTTKECIEFVEKCQQYGAERLNISVPSPNETEYNRIQEEK